MVCRTDAVIQDTAQSSLCCRPAWLLAAAWAEGGAGPSWPGLDTAAPTSGNTHTQHWELESSIDLPSVSALLDQVYRPQETEHIRHNTHSHHTGPGHFPVCRVSADKVRCSRGTDTPDT